MSHTDLLQSKIQSWKTLDADRHVRRFPVIGDWHVSSIKAVTDEDTDSPNADVMTAPPDLQRPPMYAVVLFNDDYTPMEFVIEVLQQYFALDLDRATEVMLTVHYRGKGVAGTYPRDIAETKAQQVNNYARVQGHPLLCQIEPQPQ
jgi:ATP-dependent Clp protease adaptor protein ClpS